MRRTLRMPREFVALFGLLAALAGPGCGIDADYEGTSFSCDESGQCPSGHLCTGGQCVVEGGEIADGGDNPDAGELPPPADAGVGADAAESGGCGPIGSAGDDFTGDDVGPLWEVETSGGAIAEVRDGEAFFGLSQAGGSEGVFATVCRYDLRGGRAYIELTRAPDEGEAFFELIGTDDSAGVTMEFAIEIEGGQLSMRSSINGQNNTVSIGFDGDDHRWLAMAARDGEISFEMSPDGIAWESEHTHALPESVAAEMDVRFGLRANSSGQSGGEARFDRFNGGAP